MVCSAKLHTNFCIDEHLREVEACMFPRPAGAGELVFTPQNVAFGAHIEHVWNLAAQRLNSMKLSFYTRILIRTIVPTGEKDRSTSAATSVVYPTCIKTVIINVSVNQHGIS